MNLSKRIGKLEAVTTGTGRMHVIPCRVDETEDAAQARYMAETGATIGPRDMVVVLQRFGDGRGRLKRTQQGELARCPNLPERMKAAISRGKARREGSEASHG